jgi:hypothetical protein
VHDSESLATGQTRWNDRLKPDTGTRSFTETGVDDGISDAGLVEGSD